MAGRDQRGARDAGLVLPALHGGGRHPGGVVGCLPRHLHRGVRLSGRAGRPGGVAHTARPAVARGPRGPGGVRSHDPGSLPESAGLRVVNDQVWAGPSPRFWHMRASEVAVASVVALIVAVAASSRASTVVIVVVIVA